MKIINIIPHPPAYELYINEPRPKINWNTPNGSWVGIWGYDWADQIGNEILKRTNKFSFEVWQPDLRADKIYEHKFENGLIHKLFPANRINSLLPANGNLSCPEMVLNIFKEKLDNKLILVLHGAPFSNSISRNIIYNFSSLPIIVFLHGEYFHPLSQLIKFRKNVFIYFKLIKQYYEYIKYFKFIDAILYTNEKNIEQLKKFNTHAIIK